MEERMGADYQLIRVDNEQRHERVHALLADEDLATDEDGVGPDRPHAHDREARTRRVPIAFRGAHLREPPAYFIPADIGPPTALGRRREAHAHGALRGERIGVPTIERVDPTTRKPLGASRAPGLCPRCSTIVPNRAPGCAHTSPHRLFSSP